MTIFHLVLLNSAVISVNALGSKGWEAQLYEDLLYDYNKIPRPVKNSSDILLVDVGASLIRIIDVDEKNQVLTTNVWLEMRWTDIKLRWNPEKYGGIKSLHIPISFIWSPDIVLYNNAAGDPDITIFTDAHVAYDGRVYWQPPAIYKSFCSIDVTWFPYDLQNCNMKFGAWSYTGFYVDLRQLPHEKVATIKDADGSDIEFMENGMDLSFFYRSAEWDLLSLTSARHSVLYASCCGPEKYVDITYYFVLRRKTLFFTTNLIVPCFLISFLTTFVFYLSDHKITLSISILVTLTVFFLVLIDLMPPTSLVIPMFGRYLTTTLILVSLSTMVSVVSVNFRYRSGAAYQMSPWIRTVFLKWLPVLLFIKRPHRQPKPVLKKDPNFSTSKLFTQSCASLGSLAPAIVRSCKIDQLPLTNSTALTTDARRRMAAAAAAAQQSQASRKRLPLNDSGTAKNLIVRNGSSASRLPPQPQQPAPLLQMPRLSIPNHHHGMGVDKTEDNSPVVPKETVARATVHQTSIPSIPSPNFLLHNSTELSYFRYPTPCGTAIDSTDTTITTVIAAPTHQPGGGGDLVGGSMGGGSPENSRRLAASGAGGSVENVYNGATLEFSTFRPRRSQNYLAASRFWTNNNSVGSLRSLNDTKLIDPKAFYNAVDYKGRLENEDEASATNSLPLLKKRAGLKKGSTDTALEVKMVKEKINDVIFANLLRQVRFIAEHFRRNEEESEVSDDWVFVAMVLDRLFLIIFSILNVATFSILLEAPSLYDEREPLNITSPYSAGSKPLGAINN